MTGASRQAGKDRSVAGSLARPRGGRNPAVSGHLDVGTSGWHYAGWRGTFYPKDVGPAKMLAYYAGVFRSAEINGSFYRVPTEKAVAAWREGTPPGFRFAWKASRFVTHNKKLKDAGESVAFIIGRMSGLREKFGPILWQLHPMLKHDYERLARFIAVLPKDRTHTIEFRHPSWYAADILDLLAAHDIALCISDHAAAPAPWETTAHLAYVRMHGPTGRYTGRYPAKALDDLAARIAHWRRRGMSVSCYFDNDLKTAAPRDAALLVERLVERKVAGASAL
jgi:uncharacterized protein YecE (DUF72 family)